VATIQTADEIQAILERLQGEEIVALQVLGINSLKSLTPTPYALVGGLVEGTAVADRRVPVTTLAHTVVLDLQRTGKVVWLEKAEPCQLVVGTLGPTVRLVLASGRGAI
jgi:hypothetical protein